MMRLSEILMRHRRRAAAAAIVAVIAGVATVGVAGGSGAGRTAAQNDYQQCIAPDIGLPPSKQDLPQFCQAREAFLQAHSAAAIAQLKQTTGAREPALEAADTATDLANHTVPVDVTGILPITAPPRGMAAAFVSTGLWIGDVQGQRYTVYAGAEKDPITGQATHSAVILQADPAPGSGAGPQVVGTYAAPSGQEILTITAASNGIVSLHAPDGRTLEFDIAQRTLH